MDGLFDLPGAHDVVAHPRPDQGRPGIPVVHPHPVLSRSGSGYVAAGYTLPSDAEQSPALDQFRQRLADAGYSPTSKVYWTPDRIPAGATAHLDLSACSVFVTFGTTVQTQTTPQDIYNQYHAAGQLCSYIEVWDNDQTVFGIGDFYFGFLAVHT